MTPATERLARLHGIELSYEGPDGAAVEISDETVRYLLDALGARPVPGPSVETETAGRRGPRAPEECCYCPDWLASKRAWGVAAQLYELRSGRDWGIGDFAALEDLCRVVSRSGADFVGLNPLHALFLAEPERCSPFSPSNRRFLNPLYIAVDRVEGFDPSMADQGEIARLRGETFVDYAAVAALKLGALKAIWRRRAATDASALSRFRAEAGTGLERHALFEALSARMKAEGLSAGWPAWPAQYRRAENPAVIAFAAANADEVDFHVWLQWLARGQLAQAADVARGEGMRIGLYVDFAVGEAPDGSATWSNPELVVSGVNIGAPPDLFSANGQDWGLAPLSPSRLKEAGLQPYRELMETTMSGAGALRIDHAMSLQHLFWIPAGRPASEGGFVAYPMHDMIDVLADCSQRSRTIVIGEDLGHVPAGFRETMAEAAILSYRILYFERDGSRFKAPKAWPRLSLACLSTHDLPTLRGWWAGSDIALRRDHALIDRQDADRQEEERAAERKGLLRTLRASGALGKGQRLPAALGHEVPDPVALGVHRFVARTPSLLAAVRLADLVGERQPTNLPGVAEGYPNWRRRLDVATEDLGSAPLFQPIMSIFSEERPR